MVCQSGKPIELVTIGQITEELQISRATVYRWMAHSFPRPIQIGPQAVRWLRSEIEAWKAEKLESAISSQGGIKHPRKRSG